MQIKSRRQIGFGKIRQAIAKTCAVGWGWALAGVMAGIKITWQQVRDQRFLFVGTAAEAVQFGSSAGWWR